MAPRPWLVEVQQASSTAKQGGDPLGVLKSSSVRVRPHGKHVNDYLTVNLITLIYSAFEHNCDYCPCRSTFGAREGNLQYMYNHCRRQNSCYFVCLALCKFDDTFHAASLVKDN